jgi:3-oxoacyl-[acyl-carrier-protein] synthase II
MLQGKSGIGRITKFDPSDCITQIGGQLPEKYFELEREKIPKRVFKQTVRSSRMIRLCSQEAIQDSALELEEMDPYRCGVIIGTSGASVRSPIDMGGPDIQRFKIIREMVNGPPAWISLDYRIKGPTQTISADYSSGSYAIARAYDLIRWGIVDIAIAGGVDYLLTKNNIRRGNFLKILSKKNEEPEKAMRPFDKMRSGFVLSDGGGAVVLESYEHAIKRKARVYAWISGYQLSSESPSFSSPAPNEEGMAQCIEMALRNANIPKEKIGYVNANGTSNIVNDLYETLALKKVFNKHAYHLLISSQKSMIGHTMGGASAIEFAITSLALYTGKIPPTINYEHFDPACDLNYVPNSMMGVNDMEAAITNSFGIGGQNCVLVLIRS